MPLTTKPLNQNVLIEVNRENPGVSVADNDQVLEQGKLIDYNVSRFHLTASAAVDLGIEYKRSVEQHLESLKGHTVRWEQYAEGGQTFKQDGVTYALIPWWRLISVDENNLKETN